MSSRAAISGGFLLAVLFTACASAGPNGEQPGTGGDDGSGGGGSSTGGKSGGTGGSPGTGGTPGTGGSEPGTGGTPASDAGATGGAPEADAGSPGGGDDASVVPPATGQGPVAEGKIAFNQDFEKNMDGMTRSPNGLPVERIQIVDDPASQRGKVVRIIFQEGDDYRTSGGTQPRSWFSSAMGYTVKPGSTVSVAWGFMWDNVNMNAHFAQLIRNGGPTWMWDVDATGNVSMTSHSGSGATGKIMQLEPMKWYDFMVTTKYTPGGETNFYVNGKKVLTGKSPGGPDGRFDFGIYTRPGAHPTRTVYLSNVSIGEL